MPIHVWNEKYWALYTRTYRILNDAGISEKLADQLATHRTLVAAVKVSGQPFLVSSTAELASPPGNLSPARPTR
jgi:hypothetical protein